MVAVVDEAVVDEEYDWTFFNPYVSGADKKHYGGGIVHINFWCTYFN